MEAKVSEEINQFLRKNEPHELVFARVLYMGFGGLQSIFLSTAIFKSP